MCVISQSMHICCIHTECVLYLKICTSVASTLNVRSPPLEVSGIDSAEIIACANNYTSVLTTEFYLTMVAGWSSAETEAIIGMWCNASIQNPLDGVQRKRYIYEAIAKELRSPRGLGSSVTQG